MTISTIICREAILLALEDREDGEELSQQLTKPRKVDYVRIETSEVEELTAIIDSISYVPPEEGGPRPPMAKYRKSFLKFLRKLTEKWFSEAVCKNSGKFCSIVVGKR